MQLFEGKIIDIVQKEIFPGQIVVDKGIIQSIKKTATSKEQYLLPGFIDAHVHIESSMTVPSEFARLAVVHGTIATVSDPHEIANVLGIAGVEYMIESGNQVPFKFYFGAPSCVPATPFETAGATIGPNGIRMLLAKPEIKYLAEMMNWPGVLNQDPEVMEKIQIAHKMNKPVDGHAPGLIGNQAHQYIDAGIYTDHECFTYEEAKNKLDHGMKILIREGSAAKNFEALIPLLAEYPEMIMFCSDDKHPDNLEEGHINQLVKRTLEKGHELFAVLRAASLNPKMHYNLETGLLQEGDPADFIIIDHLDNFNILETYIDGQLTAKEGETRIQSTKIPIINQFLAEPLTVSDIKLPALSDHVRVIEALEGQLITNELILPCKTENGNAVSDIENDILKLVVQNRYSPAKPAMAFIKNFNFQSGAIASSVGHDSHNIIAVGTDDNSICAAINHVIKEQGGISAVNDNNSITVPLPIAGLMSDADGYKVAVMYSEIDKMAKEMGSTLNSPFMTLSFMALLVIPSIKLSDKGLFDGEKFQFVDVFVND